MDTARHGDRNSQKFRKEEGNADSGDKDAHHKQTCIFPLWLYLCQPRLLRTWRQICSWQDYCQKCSCWGNATCQLVKEAVRLKKKKIFCFLFTFFLRSILFSDNFLTFYERVVLQFLLNCIYFFSRECVFFLNPNVPFFFLHMWLYLLLIMTLIMFLKATSPQFDEQWGNVLK